jgi:hypothetical protein
VGTAAAAKFPETANINAALPVLAKPPFDSSERPRCGFIRSEDVSDDYLASRTKISGRDGE